MSKFMEEMFPLHQASVKQAHYRRCGKITNDGNYRCNTLCYLSQTDYDKRSSMHHHVWWREERNPYKKHRYVSPLASLTS